MHYFYAFQSSYILLDERCITLDHLIEISCVSHEYNTVMRYITMTWLICGIWGDQWTPTQESRSRPISIQRFSACDHIHCMHGRPFVSVEAASCLGSLEAISTLHERYEITQNTIPHIQRLKTSLRGRENSLYIRSVV